MVRWTSDVKICGSTPGLSCRVVSLDKKLYSTFSLSQPRCINRYWQQMLRVTL